MTGGARREWSRIRGGLTGLLGYLRARRRRIVELLPLAIIVLLLLATVVVLFWRRDTTFSVTAVTETASVVVDDRIGVAVRLPQTVVLSRSEEVFLLASLEVARGVSMTVTRKREGDLFIRVEWGDGIKDGARLVRRDGSTVALSSGDNLRTTLERPSPHRADGPIRDTVTLAFQGTLRIGEDVGPLVSQTLLEGRVLMVERAPILRHRFAVSEALLEPGDVAEWRMKNGIVPPVGGFIHVGSEPALRVTAHGAADHVVIDRFGAAPYEIRPTIWNRVARDPAVAQMGALLMALAALFTIYDLGMRRVRGENMK